MSFKNVNTTLASAVADNGTFTVAYPTNTNSGTFFGGTAHKMFALQTLYSAPADFTLAFGASSITVTYLGSTTLPAGTDVALQLDILGESGELDLNLGDGINTSILTPVLINLGAPITADADGVCASQSGTAATAMTIAGALASGGVATFDVPRNVVAAWTGTAVLTVTGTDVYGETVVESSASGTSLAGKKAFKTITSVVPSANITSATVGTGDVLGLPVLLPQTGLVIRELQDGAAPTAGTIVAGVSSTATATTGDVRGTYDPNAAADGSKAFGLIALLPTPSDLGAAQYGG